MKPVKSRVASMSFREKLRFPSHPRAKVNQEGTTGRCMSTPLVTIIYDIIDDISTAKNSLHPSEPSPVYVVLTLP